MKQANCFRLCFLWHYCMFWHFVVLIFFIIYSCFHGVRIWARGTRRLLIRQSRGQWRCGDTPNPLGYGSLGSYRFRWQPHGELPILP